MSWHQEVSSFLEKNDYDSLAQWYEQQVETNPDDVNNYWYLGLAYLLSEQEELAQTTWLLVLSEAEEVEEWKENLVDILEDEAFRQESLKQYNLSLLIRFHIREFVPDNLINLLLFMMEDIHINGFVPDSFPSREIIELLAQENITPFISETLLDLIIILFGFPYPEVLNFAEACLPYVIAERFVIRTLSFNVESGCQYKNPVWSLELSKLCLKAQPGSLYLTYNLYVAYNLAGLPELSLEMAYELERISQTSIQKIFALSVIIYTLQKEGNWQNLTNLIAEFKQMLLDYIGESQIFIKEDFLKGNLLSMIYPLKYYEDTLNTNKLQNKLAKLFQENLPNVEGIEIARSPRFPKQPAQKLNIGYIGGTLRRHSVGWLSRWLIHYHDRSRFQIHIYLLNQKNDDITVNWFQKRPEDKTYNFNTIQEALKQIESDAIDILIDLDSITSSITCQILALKPAPIQITWLGYDASGIPGVDYFIADNYCLPENAQDYYREKIWRLPNSYLSVDGFEVGAPTLRRDELGIPENGVVYLTSQTGLKRHPDTIRSQMRILAGVPDSYLLVKGLGDSQTIREMFRGIAIEEGVSPERLRFLPIEASEEIHRANLMIADVVLDTYPYGGATTTLEVLWMGIPLVTKVGQQFAARNSYTFMVNAGISEGIAWSDSEYVNWGIKFGTDEVLRKEVVEKLRLSRQTEPLWKAEEFTREMERAYQQIWQLKIEN